MGKKNQKEYVTDILKDVEDALRYMVDEGFVKKVGERFFMRTEKEIEEEIEDVQKNN
jgi:hypothetical protein